MFRLFVTQTTPPRLPEAVRLAIPHGVGCLIFHRAHSLQKSKTSMALLQPSAASRLLLRCRGEFTAPLDAWYQMKALFHLFKSVCCFHDAARAICAVAMAVHAALREWYAHLLVAASPPLMTPASNATM